MEDTAEPKGSRGGIKRIVVGVDGSEHAAAALGWAITMAKGMGSEIVAVFAIAPAVYFDTGYAAPTIPVQFDEQWRADIQKEFEENWCRVLRDAGVKYRTVIADGRAASVIMEAADQANADVVIAGRRGRGEVAELLLGSVSHELVLHCKRPVLVISSLPAR
ncbi:MAG TPA: universal stress protein [Candidatus Dormibacteraeota bacterium]|nr:universal stress protein [Candidatus Dormibacteraeota bacterium]